MNKIFFSSEGLTSTSANHICNLAKELYQDLESFLLNISFYSQNLTLLGSGNDDQIRMGTSPRAFANIHPYLQQISKCKSLIAYLREAIKAKQSLLNNITEEYALKELGLEYPKAPELEHILTEEEYYNSLPLKQRNHYYELETKASVFGKAIHPDGFFSKARKDLQYIINNPTKVQGNGRDTLIYKYSPTVPTNDVEDLFFELQAEHRETQAQLNSMKYACEQAILESKTASETKFSTELKEYHQEFNTIHAKVREFITKKTAEVSKLKIVIPDSLQTIYERISQLGK